jgi:hypothetical protein
MLRPQTPHTKLDEMNSTSTKSNSNSMDSQQTTLEGLIIRLVLAIIGLEPAHYAHNANANIVDEDAEVEIDTYGRIRGRQPRHVVQRAM